MKTLSAVITLSALMSFATFADESTLPPAPANDIAQLTEVCQQMASEDQVENAELKQYVLDCVNDQLTEMGYQTVKELNWSFLLPLAYKLFRVLAPSPYAIHILNGIFIAQTKRFGKLSLLKTQQNSNQKSASLKNLNKGIFCFYFVFQVIA